MQKNKTILIVDDNQRNIFALSAVLKANGCKIISAVDGKDGIEKLKENNNIDIILMDIMMPVMDGYQAIGIIRTELKSKIPIIALTANAMPEDRQKCIDAGANDYCSKPVEFDEISEKIKHCLLSNDE